MMIVNCKFILYLVLRSLLHRAKFNHKETKESDTTDH